MFREGGRARLRAPAAALRARSSPRREIPATFAFSRRGGHRDACRSTAAARVAGPRLRMAAPARRSDVRARRRGVAARAGRLRRALAAPAGLPARRPTRRGSRPGWARSRSARSAPPDALALFDRALARGDGDARDAHQPGRRAGGAGPAGEAAAAWDAVIARAGDIAAGAAGPATGPRLLALVARASSAVSSRRLSRTPTNRASSCGRPRRCGSSTDQRASGSPSGRHGSSKGVPSSVGRAVAVLVEQRRRAGEVRSSPVRPRHRTRRRAEPASAPRPAGQAAARQPAGGRRRAAHSARSSAAHPDAARRRAASAASAATRPPRRRARPRWAASAVAPKPARATRPEPQREAVARRSPAGRRASSRSR